MQYSGTLSVEEMASAYKEAVVEERIAELEKEQSENL